MFSTRSFFKENNNKIKILPFKIMIYEKAIKSEQVINLTFSNVM